MKLEKNTLIVLTSDNGGIRDISRQDPLRAGKGSYYEGGIRVPLIVKYPERVEAGSTCNTRVTNLDFFPTFQQILNVESEIETLDGVDISPLLSGEEIADRDLFWHFPIYLQAYNKKTDDGRDPLFRTRPGCVMISGNWKLHEYFEDGKLELYDITKDEGERNDLVNAYPKRAKELHQKMKNWRIHMDAPVPTKLNPLYDAAFELE